ncbi:MAG: septum formation initiator family protein [Dysgonamonadaceae bacterium]|jgi:cell division protein FtsB|nr:septum formation initiator family protein [Dysgonamonadaceae bacterium]
MKTFNVRQFIDEKANSAKKRYFGLSGYQILAMMVLVLMLFFFSDSSVIERVKNDAKIKEIKKEIEYYRSLTESDKKKLQELRSDKDNLEKFARENYLMKKENEDVFVIE